MTDAWGYDETDPNQNTGPKALRDAYDAQKQANKDLAARLAAMEKTVAQNQVKDLLENHGVPRSAAQYYTGDADADKVTSWVNDMRATFGGAVPQNSVTAQAPAIPDSDIQKLQSMSQAGSNGTTPGNYDTALQAMNDPNLSTADRIAAWQAYARNAQ